MPLLPFVPFSRLMLTLPGMVFLNPLLLLGLAAVVIPPEEKENGGLIQ